jgi:16S rRNA (cytosine967-C5)-methyltransferase
MHAHSYLKSSVEILDEYKGRRTIRFFLKKIFWQNKKYGSKDRKQVSHLMLLLFQAGKSIVGYTGRRKNIDRFVFVF